VSVTYIVCESFPAYVQHIRRLDTDDLGTHPLPNYGGYTEPHEALCGRLVKSGWDTKLPLPSVLRPEEWCRPLLGAYFRCRKCCEAYVEQMCRGG